MSVTFARLAIHIGVVAVLFTTGPSQAQTFPVQIDGRITKYWADISDVILELDNNGPCGSIYYHILRSNTNFEQMSALMMTAAASGRTVRLQLSGCSGTHNIVTHGAAFF